MQMVSMRVLETLAILYSKRLKIPTRLMEIQMISAHMVTEKILKPLSQLP